MASSSSSQRFSTLVTKLPEIPSELLALIMKTIPKSEIIIRSMACIPGKSTLMILSMNIVRNIVMSKDWATINGFCEISRTCRCAFPDTEYTEYSAQELVDRSRIGRRSKEYHFCYTYSIRAGLDYVIKNGLQKARDCPYCGCRPAERIPQRVTSGLAHIDSVDQLSLSQSLDRLEHQPVGASLLIFMPDYLLTRKGVYRGPMKNRSSYTAVHGVSVVAVVEEDGEKVCKVRLNHGLAIGDGEGYLKVSMEMLVRVPTEGGESDGKFDKPGMLLRDFICDEVEKETFLRNK
ncbi:hypothetical protein Bca52824_089686 [Brassica carinata]|uniref:Uncharacterized protein n=1 Tax=Brassica carinata TaxID=52824 RepID=A0A8X7PGA2_BRACI|nr:hypothetical protein Bca52824_089686 [Brassica carinata]